MVRDGGLDFLTVDPNVIFLLQYSHDMILLCQSVNRQQHWLVTLANLLQALKCTFRRRKKQNTQEDPSNKRKKIMTQT